MGKNRQFYIFFIMISFFIGQLNYTFNDAFFWKPPTLFYEPRFETDYLGTVISSLCYGKIHDPYCVRLHFFEFIFDWYQNMQHGFFIHCNIPIRTLDYSFYDHHKTICQKASGIADGGVALGWTINYEDTVIYDFIDFTIQLGCTVPLMNQIPSMNSCTQPIIPIGYGNNKTIMLQQQAAIGLYDWITMAADVGIQWIMGHKEFFAPHYLQYDRSGLLFHGGISLKADHFLRSISFQCAYHFHQLRNYYALCSWKRHTLHYVFEYDAATFQHPHAPLLQCGFHHALGGKNILSTQSINLLIGIFFCF